MGDPLLDLGEALAGRLGPLGFRRMADFPAPPGIAVQAAWRRRTWNTNRAVILLPCPASRQHLGQFAQQSKMRLGKAAGYFPFLYPVGLQLVIAGRLLRGRADRLEEYVDKIDNQRAVLQSLFAVDLTERAYTSARTWGQLLTGRFQDAIEAAIAEHLAGPGASR